MIPSQSSTIFRSESPSKQLGFSILAMTVQKQQERKKNASSEYLVSVLVNLIVCLGLQAANMEIRTVRAHGVFGEMAHDQTLNLHDIFRSLHKGKGDPIHANAQHEFQIFAILGCEGTNLEHRVGCVDTL